MSTEQIQPSGLRVPFSRPALFLALLVGTSSFAFGEPPSAPSDPSRDFVPPATAIPASGALGSALASVSTRNLAADIAMLASPAFEGRGLGSRGLDATAEVLASALASAGLEPLGSEGTPTTARDRWFQPVPLRETPPGPFRLEVESRSGERVELRVFSPGVDCFAAPLSPRTIEAPVVFAGLGIREPKLARDDYRGLDVRGKIVLVLAGLPPGDAWQADELRGRYAPEDPDDRWDARLELARELGALAVLGVEEADFAERLASGALAPETTFHPGEPEENAPPPMLVRVSRNVARTLIDEATLARAEAGGEVSRPLAGSRAHLVFAGEERAVAARNVVAVLRGSDPTLREEAIVVGAHYDHLGRRGATLYPGADDNASGTSALLAIARAFAASAEPPRRSVVFVFWTGEEEGHFGSRYYVRHPRWPLARTVAYLNLDMIGHPWSSEEIRKLVADAKLAQGEAFLAGLEASHFVEPGLPPGAALLEQALRRAAAIDGLALHFDRTDGKHGGSDYRDFARRDIPFVRFFGNFFPDYHEPGDRADRLDASQVERMTRLALATAWEVANP